MSNDKLDLLVVAAHPDDAELAIGGSILLAKEQGLKVGIVDCTRGELSSRGDLQTRAIETQNASELMGLDFRENLGLSDGDLNDTKEAREKLVDCIRRTKPHMVLAPWKEDLHPDHAGAGKLLERAFYLSGIGKFAAGQAPSRPVQMGFYMCHTDFPPSAIVDVSAHWDRKVEVVRAYQSQFHQQGKDGPKTKISSPDFLQAIEGRARHYGLLAGAKFGEPIIWQAPIQLTRLGHVFSGGESQ